MTTINSSAQAQRLEEHLLPGFLARVFDGGRAGSSSSVRGMNKGAWRGPFRMGGDGRPETRGHEVGSLLFPPAYIVSSILRSVCHNQRKKKQRNKYLAVLFTSYLSTESLPIPSLPPSFMFPPPPGPQKSQPSDRPVSTDIFILVREKQPLPMSYV